MEEEDLSEEQLHQLLKDAEQRMRNTRGAQHSNSISSLPKSIPRVTSNNVSTSYIKSTDNGAHIESSHFVKTQDRRLSNRMRKVEDPVAVKFKATSDKKATSGSEWYNLPRTILTPELKRDLQLLKMRSVLDPKRHYKKDGSKLQIPKFSQVGTIIEGPTEFHSARLSNKERKRTLVEEVLAGESATQRFKSKYKEIQAAKTSGKKGHYKNMKAQRRVRSSKS